MYLKLRTWEFQRHSERVSLIEVENQFPRLNLIRNSLAGWKFGISFVKQLATGTHYRNRMKFGLPPGLMVEARDD